MRGRDVRAFRGVAVALLVGATLCACAPMQPAPGETTPTSAVPQPSETVSQTPSPSVSDSHAPEPGVEVQLSVSRTNVAGGTLSLNAFVVDIVENGGTCTLILDTSSGTLTASVEAEAAATTTNCHLLEAHGVPAGSWDGTVRYSSANAHGEVSFHIEVTP